MIFAEVFVIIVSQNISQLIGHNVQVTARGVVGNDLLK